MEFNNQPNRNQGGAFYEQAMRDNRRKHGAAARAERFTAEAVNPAGTISRRAYNLIIGLVILWGVGLDTVICQVWGEQLAATMQRSWTWMLLYLALVIGGMIIIHAAKNPVVSFLGFNLVVVGFGVTLAMVVPLYAPGVVLEAFLVTTIVTAFMLLMGQIWQDFFARIGVVLCGALIAVILVEVIMLLVTGTYPTWISVVSALIFSGFIGYDWSMAQKAPPTAKNAVMFATSLYVDIINLFLDILRIVGNDR
ncbi:MAG: US12 family protein [Eubacterium sp.]|nr:US12 family protein [Eubacterium sp.]